jgi:hypothetical protein
MLAVSPGFLAALAAPHQVTLRADVSKAGVRLYSGLPVIDGSVEVDSSSITRRRMSCQLGPRLPVGTYGDVPTLPASAGDPLGHYGQEITISWGLTYTNGLTEWLPVGVFRVEGASGSLLSDGPVQVSGVSREAYVADARFTAPYTASSGSAQSLIGTLIHEVLPTVEVVVTASMDRRVPRTTWDEDRWAAITDLATSIAAVVYADPYGRFVIADAPTLGSPSVWRVSGSTADTVRHVSLFSDIFTDIFPSTRLVDPGIGGVLVSAVAASSRARVYNGVIVRGESPSSDAAPVQGSAYDLTAGSPTRWGDPSVGAFGMVPMFMAIPTVTTAEQAVAVARANLAKHVGAVSNLDVSAVPNAALEVGDVVEVIPDAGDPAGSVRRHVVDSFTLPLVAGGDFPMSTRDVGSITYA